MIILALLVLGLYVVFLAYQWFAAAPEGSKRIFADSGAAKGASAPGAAPATHSNVDDWAASMMAAPKGKKKSKGSSKKNQ